ncbi:phage portal protein [Sharpea azabuensis]
MFDSFKRLIRSRNGKDSRSKSLNTVYSVEVGGRASWGNSFDFNKGLPYDNSYPSISRIADSFCAIRPYAIDSNGKPLRTGQARALDAIYNPNQRMSAVMFRYALATSVLTHRKTYLLAYSRQGREIVAGGQITEQNLAGFSFIQNATVQIVNGQKTYRISGSDRTFNKYEVLEISVGSDPYDITAGYAPTVSARKWADIDDFIASYQGGFFENGAVPAGQFIITAPTVEAYDEIVDKIQRSHRGAGNNNNVIYTHRPISPDTGAPLNSQIEWVPFSQTNQSLDLKNIFDQVNNKIDSAFGVPASIRGVSNNNSYASAQVDERTFTKYVLEPFATKLWDCFTHELNRITGGLGYAITFDLDIPAVADEEKVDAERKKTELDLIITAQNAGFTLDSIITAFDLSNGYKLLKMAENDNSEPTVIENDKPEVDEGGEVEDGVETEDTESPKESRAVECHHHDELIAHKSADRETIRSLREVFDNQYDEEIVKAIDQLETVVDNDQLVDMLADLDLSKLTEADISYLSDELGIDLSVDDEKTNWLTTAFMGIVLARMLKSGSKQSEQTINELGLDIPDEVRAYAVTAGAKEVYNDIISQIVNNFVKDNSKSISSSITRGMAESAKKLQEARDRKEAEKVKREVREKLEKELKTLPKKDSYRVERIVSTEEHRAENLGRVDSIDRLNKMAHLKLKLKWVAGGSSPCEFCLAMNGTTINAGDVWLPVGGTIEGENGGVFLNDYEPMSTPNAHPNCHCDFVVVKEVE